MFDLIINFVATHTLSTIYFIFSLLFLFMAWKEWEKSKKMMNSLRPSLFKSGVSIKIAGINFESFVSELEKANQESHQIAATSYFLAGLTAIASFITSLL